MKENEWLQSETESRLLQTLPDVTAATGPGIKW